MSGPYETQRQAADAARHIIDSPPGTGAWQDGSHRLMEGACRAAGVKLGAYDEQILVWLAGWEPWVCAVIAGLITRAHHAGQDILAPAVLAGNYDLTSEETALVSDALDVAAEYRRYRASLTCEACASHPAELCDGHQADLDRAEQYDDLAETLRRHG